jgi:DNA-directed RNA polymerase specialized sigma24 family protein/outer membrane biosynthesis protein TonB
MIPNSPAQKENPIGPDLRAALVAMVRKRVPESDVEDIVQATLTEAVVSPHAPRESDALRRWLFGVAKNKVVDFHRRRGRESFDLPDVAGSPAPHQEADLLRWAEKNLPPGEDAAKTLDWMLREGEGEKLESIAESEHVPAPRVRQRVSRLRRHFKENWKREVAMLAALGVLITVAIALWLREKEKPEIIAHDPNVVPLDPRAEELRKDGVELCAKSQWSDCVEKLDDAKRLDPAGDTRPEVRKAREDAAKAKEISPEPAPSPTTTNLTPPPESTTPTKAPAPAPSSIPSTWNPPEPDSKSLTTPSPKSVATPAPPPKPTAAPVTKYGKPSAFDLKEQSPKANDPELQKKLEQSKKKSAPSKTGNSKGGSDWGSSGSSGF